MCEGIFYLSLKSCGGTTPSYVVLIPSVLNEERGSAVQVHVQHSEYKFKSEMEARITFKIKSPRVRVNKKVTNNYMLHAATDHHTTKSVILYE